jgi:hypothetical protein
LPEFHLRSVSSPIFLNQVNTLSFSRSIDIFYFFCCIVIYRVIRFVFQC